MMTRHERALEIASSCRLPGNEFFDIIERHLREYAEEAVREAEDRARYKPTSEEIQEEIIREENRPTAEDALKAVKRLAWKLDHDTGVSNSYGNLHNGVCDLLAGQRDTDAAKAITGEHEGGKR